MTTPAATPSDRLLLRQMLMQRSVQFVENRGQNPDPDVRYYARSGTVVLYFMPDRAVFVFPRKESPPPAPETPRTTGFRPKGSASPATSPEANKPEPQVLEGVTLALRFVGADPGVRLQGRKRIDGVYNFFRGNDPSRWQAGVAAYEEVVYRDLWPGIDLFFRLAEGKIKYEFIVQPGADASAIRLAYDGAEGIDIDAQGNLVIRTALGDLVDDAPSAVSVFSEGSRAVTCAYDVEGHDDGAPAFGYRLGRDYDPRFPLVIDPGIDYSSFLAGTDDDVAYGVEVDSSGCAYVTGWTFSDDFPTTPGAFKRVHQGAHDVFVTKMNASGTNVIYSTFIGGSRNDEGYAIEIDPSGCAYVCGVTDSPDFPVTTGAFQTTLPGTASGFVVKLNPNGNNLIFSTYLGGSGDDQCRCIKVDGTRNVYVTGSATSSDFPVTAGALQTARRGPRDAFVTKLNTAGNALVYSTFLGGDADEAGNDMDLDSLGQVYVVGQTNSNNFPVTAGAFQTSRAGDYDAFVTKLNAAGSGLVYSTYLGGTLFDQGTAIEVDDSGHAYVTGSTYSSNFPTTPGVFQPAHQGYHDVFVTKLNPAGSGLVYSTYIGGAGGDDLAWGIDVDSLGCAIIVGETYSPDYPVTPDAIQAVYGGFGDAILTKLNPSGSGLIFSSYSGGVLNEACYYITVDSYGDAYVVGQTHSHDFPATPGAFQPQFVGQFGLSDAFVTKLRLGYHPPVQGEGFRLTRYVINTTDDFPDDSQQLDADFFLVYDERKVIYGTVRFPDGTPVPAAAVKFFKVNSGDPESTCDLEAIGHAITDDCGTFLLGPLPPGVNVVMKIFFLKQAAAVGTATPIIGTATPIDP